jgi:hypothetical protein
MPNLDIRSAGNDPKQSAMWLDGEPCIVKGFTEWLNVGDWFVIGVRSRQPHEEGR